MMHFLRCFTYQKRKNSTKIEIFGEWLCVCKVTFSMLSGLSLHGTHLVQPASQDQHTHLHRDAYWIQHTLEHRTCQHLCAKIISFFLHVFRSSFCSYRLLRTTIANNSQRTIKPFNTAPDPDPDTHTHSSALPSKITIYLAFTKRRRTIRLPNFYSRENIYTIILIEVHERRDERRNPFVIPPSAKCARDKQKKKETGKRWCKKNNQIKLFSLVPFADSMVSLYLSQL